MKKNNKAIWLCLLLMAVFFMISAKPAQAASYRQIAYINSSEKRLVLKFKPFHSAGYTWSVKANDNPKAIMTGSLGGGTTTRFLKVNLGSKYKTKTRYTLTVWSKDKKKSLVVKYYSGSALTRAAVSKNSNDQLKVSCNLDENYIGNAGDFLVFKGDHSTNLLASTKLVKKSATNHVGLIPKTSLSSGEYKTYVILNYTLYGETYYGQGQATTFKYIKPVPKVTGIRISTANSRVKLSWNPSIGASYYKVYQSIHKNGSYKLVGKKVYGSSYSREVKGGNTYYYKIEAVAAAGSKTVSSAPSSIKSIKVAVTPGKVRAVRFAYDMDENLLVRWNSTINTSGYIVYYKLSTSKTFKKLGTTKNRTYKLSKLDRKKTYDITVVAYRKSGDTKTKATPSKILTIQPASYEKAHRKELLANSVRTIEHVGTKSIYTTRNYSRETKLAFVNEGGYSSNTKYLIWISHYTQQVVIYKGSKGHWKIIRVCDTATGRAVSPSPIGVFKTTYKETGWYYVNTKELYVTHYCGRNSFHTRPLYNSGGVCTSTIGRPASHGCARLYNSDAKYIYDNIPSGTTVVSY